LGTDTALAPTVVSPNGTALFGATVPEAPAVPGSGDHESPDASPTTTAVAARHRRVRITRVNVTASRVGCHPVHSLIASISIRKRA